MNSPGAQGLSQLQSAAHRQRKGGDHCRLVPGAPAQGTRHLDLDAAPGQAAIADIAGLLRRKLARHHHGKTGSGELGADSGAQLAVEAAEIDRLGVEAPRKAINVGPAVNRHDPAATGDRQPYNGNVSIKPNGDAATVTMLLDPRGVVHAYTGVLPVVSAALPGQLIEEFIRGLQVTFRTGPVVADPSTMRIPQPAEDHGVWSWVQAIAPPSEGQAAKWIEETIVSADDQARIADVQLQLREGWLKLSGLEEPIS